MGATQQLDSRSFNVPKFKLFFSFSRLNFAIFIRSQVKLTIKSN